MWFLWHILIKMSLARWEIGPGTAGDKPTLLESYLTKGKIREYINATREKYENETLLHPLLNVSYERIKGTGAMTDVVNEVAKTLSFLQARGTKKVKPPLDITIGRSGEDLVTLLWCINYYAGKDLGEQSAVAWISEGVSRALIAKSIARELYLGTHTNIGKACRAYLQSTLTYDCSTPKARWNWGYIRSIMESQIGYKGTKNRDFVQELGENSEKFKSISPQHIQEAIKAGFGCVLARYGIMMDMDNDSKTNSSYPKSWTGNKTKPTRYGFEGGTRKIKATVPFERAWRIVEESILSVMTPAGLLLSIYGQNFSADKKRGGTEFMREELRGGTGFMKDQSKGEFSSYKMEDSSGSTAALKLTYSSGYKEAIDAGCFAYFEYLVQQYFSDLTGDTETPPHLLALPMPHYNVIKTQTKSEEFLSVVEDNCVCDLARLMADSMNMFIVRDAFSQIRANAKLWSGVTVEGNTTIIQSHPPDQDPCPLINIVWISIVDENRSEITKNISDLCKSVNNNEDCSWQSLYSPRDMETDQDPQDDIIELAETHFPRVPDESQKDYINRLDEFVLSMKVLGKDRYNSIITALSYYEDNLELFDETLAPRARSFDFQIGPFSLETNNNNRAFVVRYSLGGTLLFLGVVFQSKKNMKIRDPNLLNKAIREANDELEESISKFEFPEGYGHQDTQMLTDTVTKICRYNRAAEKAGLTREQLTTVYAKSSVYYGALPFFTTWLLDQLRNQDGQIFYNLMYNLGPMKDRKLAMYLTIGILSLGATLTTVFPFQAMVAAISQCLNPASSISLGLGATWLSLNLPAVYDLVVNDQSTWRHTAQTLIAKHGSASAVNLLTLRDMMSIIPNRLGSRARKAAGSVIQALTEFKGLQRVSKKNAVQNRVSPQKKADKGSESLLYKIWTSSSSCLAKSAPWLASKCLTFGQAVIMLLPLMKMVYEQCQAENGKFSQAKASEHMTKLLSSGKTYGVQIFIIMLNAGLAVVPADDDVDEDKEKNAVQETIHIFTESSKEEKEKRCRQVYEMEDGQSWTWSKLFREINVDFFKSTMLGNGIFSDMMEKESLYSKRKIFVHVEQLFSGKNLRECYVYLQFVITTLSLSALLPANVYGYVIYTVMAILTWCAGSVTGLETPQRVAESNHQDLANWAVIEKVNEHMRENLDAPNCDLDTINLMDAWRLVSKTSNTVHSETKSILQNMIPIWAEKCLGHVDKGAVKLRAMLQKLLFTGRENKELYTKCYDELGLADPNNVSALAEASNRACETLMPHLKEAYKKANRIIEILTAAAGDKKWSLKCQDSDGTCFNATFGGMVNATVQVQNCNETEAVKIVKQIVGEPDRGMIGMAKFIDQSNGLASVNIPEGTRLNTSDNASWFVKTEQTVTQDQVEEINKMSGWYATVYDSTFIVLTYAVRCTLQSLENEMHKKAHTTYFSEMLAQQTQVRCPKLKSSDKNPYVWLNMNMNDDSPFLSWKGHLEEYDNKVSQLGQGEGLRPRTVARGANGNSDSPYFNTEKYSSNEQGGLVLDGKGIVLNSDGFARIPGAMCGKSQ